MATKGRARQLGLYRFEIQVTPCDGRYSTSGLGPNTPAKEAMRVGFDYFKGNLNRVSTTAKFSEHEYHLHVAELHKAPAPKPIWPLWWRFVPY
jgi:ATP-dependent Lon protease